MALLDPSQPWPGLYNLYFNDKIMKNKTFYHKIYIPWHEEKNSKKHTITESQVNNLVGMMNSDNEEDIDMAISILSKSNCNKYYDDVIWDLIIGEEGGARKPKWFQHTSKDQTNKRIVRNMDIIK